MTLTIQDLGALGEFLGSIAVLVTLIYLAFQTRQNRMAIAAQLDAQRISSNLHVGMAVATSTELQEALREDWIDPPEINEVRRNQLWSSTFLFFQWSFSQAQRGLLPTFNEVALAGAVLNHFNRYRSFERWWDRTKARRFPEFVEWVEEQRSKAA